MGIGSRLSSFFSLDADINKAKEGGEDIEGVISDFIPELKLDLKDEELLKMAKRWTENWKRHYESNLEAKQKESESYWLGKGSELDQTLAGKGTRPQADNLIFEAVETFLPVATKQNPEPIVTADNTEIGMALSDKVQKFLQYHADILRLKLKIKSAARNWSLYYLGVAKLAWSEENNDITIKVIRTPKLILDPNGTIEEGFYTGEYVGEPMEDTASNLIERFPSKKGYISSLSKGDLGTKIGYTEWWTNDYLFWTIKDTILDKIRNPHWNYDEEVDIVSKTVDEDGNEIDELDEEGNPVIAGNEVRKGKNHFPVPKMPYIFLSVFNLGKHPHDDTSLIEQNLSNQDQINKRTKQIDKNIDNINGGWVVSLQNAGLNKEEAAQAVEAIRKGGTVAIPQGTPSQAIERMQGQSLGSDVYNERQDARNQLRNIFGVTGLSTAGIQNEGTVRGKIIAKGTDGDRIGGGVAEYIEQFADGIFNYMVQLYYVYYDEEHAASIIGNEGAVEYITLMNDELDRKLVVSVKEGSMIPKDSLTRRNEAIDLWGAGAIDPLTLYERLEFPNPREAVKKLVGWNADPMSIIGGNEAVGGGAGLPGGIPGVNPEEAELNSIVNNIPIG